MQLQSPGVSRKVEVGPFTATWQTANASLAGASAERDAGEDFAGLGGAQARAVLSALPAGVVVLDRAGIITACNPAAVRLLGLPLQGERWRKVIKRCLSDSQPAASADAVALKGGRLVRIETRPVDDTGQVLLFHDVTEVSALETRLAAQGRAITLGKVSASLAHQIRTPVSAALLYSEMLADPASDPELMRQFASKIHERLTHVEKLTQQILQFVRGPNRGRSQLDFDAIVQQAVETVRARFPDALSRLEVGVAPGLPPVHGSPELVATALGNLLVNAFEAGNADTRVHLRVEAGAEPESGRTDGVVLEVVDNGPGIAAELQDRILEPFFTTRPKGNGLGLAVVRDVARTHGGDLQLESIVGAGSRFSMTLRDSCAAAEALTASAAR